MRRIDFKNIGAVQDLLFPDMVNKLKESVKNFKFETATPWNKNLAGNLRHEYYFKEHWDEIEQHVLRLAKFHEEQYQCIDRLITDLKKKDLKLGSMWINFQKKGEVNPMHHHDGVYSFVIWLNIPFDLQTEQRNSPGINANANRVGMFEFVYTDALGHILAHPIPVDNKYEGTICLFPSKMPHTVYPFLTSDDYRVTISGNIIND
jgi:hypothetical protein